MYEDPNPDADRRAAYWRATALALAQQMHDEAGAADRLIACLFPTDSALASLRRVVADPIARREVAENAERNDRRHLGLMVPVPEDPAAERDHRLFNPDRFRAERPELDRVRAGDIVRGRPARGGHRG